MKFRNDNASVWLALGLLCLLGGGAATRSPAGEILYNGIVLPDVWPPPDRDPMSREPMKVPYLEIRPEIVPIDVGRQLFVDDFLIEHTTLRRTYHTPEKYGGNPVMKAETALELDGGRRPAAKPHPGGVWYDHRDRQFKMWYHTGWYEKDQPHGNKGLALSVDGLNWTRPKLDVIPGTNRTADPNPELRARAGGSDEVRIDWFARDERERFKSLNFYHGGAGSRINVSADGIHWSPALAKTGPAGDRNTFFYNPFRQRWVFSIKVELDGFSIPKMRARQYWEHPDFVRGAQWGPDDPVFWFGGDYLDEPDPEIGDPPQIYDLNVNAYESLLVGLFQIHKGPVNALLKPRKMPKVTELVVGYTRDGFHWHRPVRTPFIAASRRPGTWDRGYVNPVGGTMLVVGDRLYFYYGALSGVSPAVGTLPYAGGATGVAFLRRDGFASMDADAAGGTLTTRKLRFSGKHLFVNAATAEGELRAEVLDGAGQVIAPFSLQNCRAISTDRTQVQLQWQGEPDLGALAGRDVRIRFHLRNGRLYSFWVTPHAEGHSRGYVAAGGPGFHGPVDSPNGF